MIWAIHVSVDSASLRDVFRRKFGREAEFVSEAPGRVNLIGEHTDYNQGFVLPMAIDRMVAVAVAGALCAIGGIEMEVERLAVLCQKAENQFVGVQCGIMDQLAAARAKAGHALLIDCRSLQIEHVRLPHDLAIVVVDSKVARVLGETAYNERREECAAAARVLGVASLRDASEGDIDRLPEPLKRRTRHVVSENGQVLGAVDALRAGAVRRFGELMYESHASMRDDYGVSTPELDLLVNLASGTAGVVGARVTGAGFGGCTVNLVARDAVWRFEAAVVESYRAKTGLPAEMFVCGTVDGLRMSRV